MQGEAEARLAALEARLLGKLRYAEVISSG